MSHSTINLKRAAWVNIGTYPCRVQAIGSPIQIQVTSGTPPTDSGGAITLDSNFALTTSSMEDAFVGVVSPSVVWAKSEHMNASVSVSHA